MAVTGARKHACLFCRIRKLKCVSSGKILPNGQPEPCGNCMIYKCHCENFAGVADKSLIKKLTEEEYNELVLQKEKMNHNSPEMDVPSEKSANESKLNNNFLASISPMVGSFQQKDKSLANSLPTTGSILSFREGNIMTPSDVENKPLSFETDSGKKTKFFMPNDTDNNAYKYKEESLNLLKQKLKELEPILISNLDDSAKPFVTFLHSQIDAKTKELESLKENMLEEDQHNRWNIDELHQLTNQATYDKTTSMETTVPVDKFDIVKKNKFAQKLKKRKHSEVNAEDEPTVRAIENELLRFSGHGILTLNALLSFNLNALTGEIVTTPQLSYWENNESQDEDPDLHFLPLFFGDYNADAFICKPGLELVFKEILKSNTSFEIIPEREIKETLFLVLKYVQYHLACVNMAVDIYTEPFEYYGNNLLPNMATMAKTSDRLLYLYSKIPSELIQETLKQYPKFESVHKNIKKYISETTYAPTLFQYSVILTRTHQNTFRTHVLSFVAHTSQKLKIDDEEPDLFNHVKTMEYFEMEDFLLVMSIYFEEKSRYSTSDSLDYLESLLLRFEQMVSLYSKTVAHEMLSALTKSVRELGLHKFERYLELDESMAEKQRKLFWKCIYWNVCLQVGYGITPLFSLSSATCLLPKIFIDLGVLTIEDLKWFLLNEGYKCIINIDIKDEFEILNIGFSIIVSEFMHEVLYNRKYTGIASLLKSNEHENKLLDQLCEDLEKYNKFSTIFKVIIDNLYRKLLNMEMSRSPEEESTKLMYLKYLINASVFRSFMLTSSMSLLKRLKSVATDQAIIERADKLIELYAELVMNNELTTLNVILIADNAAFFLKSFESISKCLANIVCMVSYFSKPISSEIFINIVRLHKNQRITADRVINKNSYLNKDAIHRIPSFVNLFCHRLRLCSRIIAQLFMAQRLLNKDKLKEFFRFQLSQFISDSKELTEELDFIFDTKLLENDKFVNIQLAMNKKRYDLIMKRYKKMGKDLTKVASSKNLRQENRYVSGDLISPKPQLTSVGDINEVLKNYSSTLKNSGENADNSKIPTNFLSQPGSLFSSSNLAMSPSPKFNQSNERNQSLLPAVSPFFNERNNDVETVASTDNPSLSSVSSNNINNTTTIGRNMVERIDFGSMEDFLTNNDNLFANFWQGFNID